MSLARNLTEVNLFEQITYHQVKNQSKTDELWPVTIMTLLSEPREVKEWDICPTNTRKASYLVYRLRCITMLQHSWMPTNFLTLNIITNSIIQYYFNTNTVYGHNYITQYLNYNILKLDLYCELWIWLCKFLTSHKLKLNLKT